MSIAINLFVFRDSKAHNRRKSHPEQIGKCGVSPAKIGGKTKKFGLVRLIIVGHSQRLNLDCGRSSRLRVSEVLSEKGEEAEVRSGLESPGFGGSESHEPIHCFSVEVNASILDLAFVRRVVRSIKAELQSKSRDEAIKFEIASGELFNPDGTLLGSDFGRGGSGKSRCFEGRRALRNRVVGWNRVASSSSG